MAKDKNYTPIKLQDSKLNTILMVIAILTAAVLGIILFLLIQQKRQEQQAIEQLKLPTVIPSIVPTRQPVASPSPQLKETATDEADLTPTKQATQGATLTPAPTQ